MKNPNAACTAICCDKITEKHQAFVAKYRKVWYDTLDVEYDKEFMNG